MDLFYADDSKLEELKTKLPSPESFQFKLNPIEFEKVLNFFHVRHNQSFFDRHVTNVCHF